jgi:hypothetical protein
MNDQEPKLHVNTFTQQIGGTSKPHTTIGSNGNERSCND